VNETETETGGWPAHCGSARLWSGAPRASRRSPGRLNLARSRPAAFRDEGARQAMIRSAMMTILYPEAEVFSAPVRHDEPRFVRRDDGLGTVTQPELAQHATDVGLHGLFRDHEAVCNLDV
jgi:hypothetical protein